MSHDRSIGGHIPRRHAFDRSIVGNWTESSTRATARDAVGTLRLERASWACAVRPRRRRFRCARAMRRDDDDDDDDARDATNDRLAAA